MELYNITVKCRQCSKPLTRVEVDKTEVLLRLHSLEQGLVRNFVTCPDHPGCAYDFAITDAQGTQYPIEFFKQKPSQGNLSTETL